MFSRNIVLIGFMGTGKTSVAKELSERCGMKMTDLDQLIETRQKMSITEIFQVHGEEYFRQLETNLFNELLGEENTVISCGGGTVLRKENVAMMKKTGHVVLLTAKPQTIFERLQGCESRPLLRERNTLESIRKLLETREKRYEEAADIFVETDEKSISAICAEIINKLKGLDEE